MYIHIYIYIYTYTHTSTDFSKSLGPKCPLRVAANGCAAASGWVGASGYVQANYWTKNCQSKPDRSAMSKE